MLKEAETVNPLNLFDKATGVFKILAFFIGMGFIAWVVIVSVKGPQSIEKLEQFEAQAAQAQEQYREVVRQELHESVLAEDDWGRGAAGPAAGDDTASHADIAREAIGMMEDREGGWGVGAD